jgi:Raf kinase inhibitor-like YbhB/YbcL family protein
MVLRAILVAVMLTAGAAVPACGGGDKPESELPAAPAKLRVTSPAFDNGQTIPKRYTCDGDGVSPPLAFRGVPARARELALIVEDRDADRFVHWTVLRIPPETTTIPEGKTPPGSIETENSFGDSGWGGPCPPEDDEPHRYVFALYALSRPLGLDEDASPDEVRSAIRGAAIARGTLTGEYGR